jgi:hypothetical protein
MRKARGRSEPVAETQCAGSTTRRIRNTRRSDRATTDVGMGGCFLNVVLPLPVGSRVCVTLHHGLVHFQTEGFVVLESRRGL